MSHIPDLLVLGHYGFYLFLKNYDLVKTGPFQIVRI